MPASWTLTGIWFVDSSRGWAVGDRGTILTTNDGGANWRLQQCVTDVSFEDVVFVDPDHGWIVGDAGMILRTSDGGDTWQEQLWRSDVWFRAVDFVDPGYGWAVGYRGGETVVLHTSDGLRWMWQDPECPGELQDVDFLDRDIGWAVGREGIVLHTTDGGRTWVRQTAPTDALYLYAVQVVDDTTAWIAAQNGKVLHTIDGGRHWGSRQVGSSPVSTALTAIHFADGHNGWVLGSEAVYRTTDGGRSWQLCEEFGSKARSMHFVDSRQGWIAGVGGIVVYTGDGGESWVRQCPDGPTESFQGVRFVSLSEGWAAGSSSVRHSTDAGATWETQYRDTTKNIVDMQFVDSSNGWIAVDSQSAASSVLYTDDGGRTWTEVSLPIHGPKDVYFLDGTHGWVAAWDDMGLLRTIDGGRSWLEMPVPPPAPISTVWFIDTLKGWVDFRGALLRTTDGGRTWEKLPVELTGGPEIQIFFLDTLLGWAASAPPRIARTTDGGKSWDYAEGVQFQGMFSSLWFTDFRHGWAVGDNGQIVHTTTSGTNWVEQPSPTSSNLNAVCFVDSAHGWAVGDHGTVLRYCASESVAARTVNGRPGSLIGSPSLLTWFGFHGGTTLSCPWLTRGYSVCDLLGRHVTASISGGRAGIPQGGNPAALPAGMYVPLLRSVPGSHELPSRD